MKQDRCEAVIIHPEKIKEVQKHLLKEDDLLKLSYLFKVISDPTRIKILYALEKQELCVCDISVILNMTQSAISHQLKTLRLAHLVTSRKEGKTVFYKLADEHVQNLFRQSLDHITEV
ncbi:MAG: metalloregulator ArsR/SmtB family transcription factor [Acholeplasmataceae bacterium]|jgi:ArsR family transcriptional regulator|nr:metalloregulator ArsR/SmtB family transcription factor [Acholeplasmataceae bacterium]